MKVEKKIKKNGYKVKISEPDSQLARNINQFKPNIIFNALHGQFGEDGYIQTILEGFKIPYTHSGTVASALAMDKEISKKFFVKHKIDTPKSISYSFDKKNSEIIKLIDKKLKFPVFSKGVAPLDSKGRGQIIKIDVPVICDGVLVKPGDLICGNADGVVSVPQEHEDDVLKKAFEKIKAEFKKISVNKE